MRIGIGTSIVGQQVVAGGVQYLDEVGGTPTAAYSVDKVVSTYTDAVVRVRRASDNEEADVAFENDTITLDSAVDNFSTGSLSATLGEFVANASYSDPDSLGSPDDAFVATWYDQAGSNDATQITASDQPKIVSSGALVTENGKVALDFDGVGDALTTNIPAISGEYTVLCLFRAISYNSQNTIFGKDANNYYIRYDQFGGKRLQARHNVSYGVDILNFYASNPSTPSLTTSILEDQTTGTLRAYFNSIEIGSSSDDYLGTQQGHSIKSELQTYIQELIFYNSDKSALRTDIEDNINDRFSIYT